jgi:hypothetical protein
MPLLAGSPAIDKGSDALIPSGLTTDQRGLPRIVNGTVDIGACENQPPTLITSGPTNPLMLPSTTEGIAGDDANFTISGIGLGSGDTVTLTAPTGCEVSTNSSSGFATKLCLYPNSSGTLATTTVYARICVSATTSINGYLTIADGNQTDFQVSITVIGTVNALPILGAAKQNANMVFSWPANPTGFTLMSSTNLGSSAVWITNSTLPVVMNGTNFVTISMTGQRMYFRLKHP